MTPHNSRLGKRLSRLEDRLTPAPQREAQCWIWIKGRLHSQHTDEVYDSKEERAKVYAGRDILFVDHVLVYPAKDGKPVGYSDERYVDGLEEAWR